MYVQYVLLYICVICVGSHFEHNDIGIVTITNTVDRSGTGILRNPELGQASLTDAIYYVLYITYTEPAR